MENSLRILMVRSSMKSERVRRMGAHGHDVLQEHLVVGLGARLVAVVLQPDAAELGGGEVHHGALPVRREAVGDEAGRVVATHYAIQAVVAGETVVAQTHAPLRTPLVGRLYVPAGSGVVVGAAATAADHGAAELVGH